MTELANLSKMPQYVEQQDTKINVDDDSEIEDSCLTPISHYRFYTFLLVFCSCYSAILFVLLIMYSKTELDRHDTTGNSVFVTNLMTFISSLCGIYVSYINLKYNDEQISELPYSTPIRLASITLFICSYIPIFLIITKTCNILNFTLACFHTTTPLYLLTIAQCLLVFAGVVIVIILGIVSFIVGMCRE